MVPKVQQRVGPGTGGQGTGCILPWGGSAGGPRRGCSSGPWLGLASQMSTSSPVSGMRIGARRGQKAELSPGLIRSFSS